MEREEFKKPLEQREEAEYQAPKVTRVSLRPEEAVLGHCKITGSAGPASGGCMTGLGVCRTFGS
jgi:hypothetical protein